MRADTFDSIPELEEFGFWDEHADYIVEDWQLEVANDDTRLGYWDWVLERMEQPDEPT